MTFCFVVLYVAVSINSVSMAYFYVDFMVIEQLSRQPLGDFIFYLFSVGIVWFNVLVQFYLIFMYVYHE